MRCTKEERYSHGSALRGLHGLKKFYFPSGSGNVLKMLKILSVLPKSVTTRLIQGIGLVRNPFTLGVRVIVEDRNSRVLLVRHSYVTGWYLPGGGVDKGETMEEAACREVLGRSRCRLGKPPAASQYIPEPRSDRPGSCRALSHARVETGGHLPSAQCGNRGSGIL